jgi:hypothetical protein
MAANHRLKKIRRPMPMSKLIFGLNEKLRLSGSMTAIGRVSIIPTPPRM